MKKAAGILYVSHDGKRILLLRRADCEAEYAGTWALPGGHVEDGETAADAAVREMAEETSFRHDGELRFWTRSIRGDCDFTTHIALAKEDFQPVLNEEHSEYRWTAFDELYPVNGSGLELHPGLWVALARFGMDELGMAEAIKSGEHASPVEFMNVLMVNMRITGTGLSYRNAYEEYVWRDERYYTNERFVQRCYGLPVIWEHPSNGQPLDSKEFAKRVVGTVFLPYLKGNEVWAVVKIWDDVAREAILKEKLSTSPCVVFTPRDIGHKEPFNGEEILIEGPPSFLDHIAICAEGVWDKGGEPTGVQSATVSDAADKCLEQIEALLQRSRLDYFMRRIINR